MRRAGQWDPTLWRRVASIREEAASGEQRSQVGLPHQHCYRTFPTNRPQSNAGLSPHGRALARKKRRARSRTQAGTPRVSTLAPSPSKRCRDVPGRKSRALSERSPQLVSPSRLAVDKGELNTSKEEGSHWRAGSVCTTYLCGPAWGEMYKRSTDLVTRAGDSARENSSIIASAPVARFLDVQCTQNL